LNAPDTARAARRLRAFAGPPAPRYAVISGSGLAALAEAFRPERAIGYAAVPGFVATAVAGHPGRLILARSAAARVWLGLGRPHFYEHASMLPTARFVRTLASAGVDTLLLTNAAGGLDPALAPGDVMVLADHLFLPGLAGQHPLLGPNDPRGPRFPALADAYDASLSARLLTALQDNGLRVRRGVYAMVAGPSYETAAEAQFLRGAGAHAVGMSTVPEVVVARHAGMRVAAASVITNVAGLPAGRAEHSAVVTAAATVAAALGRAMCAVIDADARAVIPSPSAESHADEVPHDEPPPEARRLG